MGGFSPIHWVILAVIVLVLFGGGGKISSLMGDFAKGIKSFKKGMAEDDGREGDTAYHADERLSPPQSGQSQAGSNQAGQAGQQGQNQAASTQPQDVRMADNESQRPR